MSTRELAHRVVDAAGAAGGIDEVRRLAERGWPVDRGGYTAEEREAIQARARDIAAEVDALRTWTIEARHAGGDWARQDGADGLPCEHVREYAEQLAAQLTNDAAGTGVEFRAVEVQS